MSRINAFKNIVHRITKLLAYAGMLLLIPMMLMTFADVIGRKFASHGLGPVPGALELSSYMLAVFVLLGLAYTQQVRGHVGVSMFTSRLPIKARALLNILTTLLSLFVIGVLCWQGWVVGLEEVSVSDMLRIPQMPFRMLVAAGAFFLCLELIVDIISDLQTLGAR